MRMTKRNRGLWALSAAAVGVPSLAQMASAGPTDVSTERLGSIIVFPKVVWDGVRDTIIQITNTSNNQAFAHCFYINAGAPGLWNETDFDIFLTKQQPTHWVVPVSTARNVSSSAI